MLEKGNIEKKIKKRLNIEANKSYLAEKKKKLLPGYRKNYLWFSVTFPSFCSFTNSSKTSRYKLKREFNSQNKLNKDEKEN